MNYFILANLVFQMAAGSTLVILAACAAALELRRRAA
jgi:hypothetical protein